MVWTITLWCEPQAYGVNKQLLVQTNFALVWSLKLWCDHTFVLKLGLIHTLWVWSHYLWVWSYHQYGFITTHIFFLMCDGFFCPWNAIFFSVVTKKRTGQPDCWPGRVQTNVTSKGLRDSARTLRRITVRHKGLCEELQVPQAGIGVTATQMLTCRKTWVTSQLAELQSRMGCKTLHFLKPGADEPPERAG